MSSSIRRVYINSYLAYKDDPGESLQDFIADIDETITDPDDINLAVLSLNFTPKYPNIPNYEATVDISYDGTRAQYDVDTLAIYEGIASSTVGTDLITQLNEGFKTAFSTSYEPWSYDAADARIIFTPDTGTSVEIYNTGTTLSRRIGLTTSEMDTVVAAPSTITASNPPIISRTQVLFISTDLTSDSTTNGGSNHGIMMMVPVYNPDYGTLITYQPSYDFGKLASPRSFTSLRVRILDDLFRPIEFNSNTNLLLALSVTYKDGDNGFAGILRAPTFG